MKTNLRKFFSVLLTLAVMLSMTSILTIGVMATELTCGCETCTDSCGENGADCESGCICACHPEESATCDECSNEVCKHDNGKCEDHCAECKEEADGGESEVKVNYETERLTFPGGFTGAPAYVYALKVKIVDSKIDKIDKVKWLPVYGNSIDLGKIIPKKNETDPTKKYYIAYKGINEANTAAKYLPVEGRLDIKTHADYSIEKKVKIIYDADTMKLKNEVPGKDLSALEARIGIGSWVSATTIDLGVAYFATGGNVEVRIAATDDLAASPSIKVKVPKQPAAPKPKVSCLAASADPVVAAEVKLTGLKKKTTYEYETTTAGTWKTFTTGDNDTTFDIKTLNDAKIIKENSKVYIKIRLAKVTEGKTIAPYSLEQLVELNVAHDAFKDSNYAYFKGEVIEPETTTAADELANIIASEVKDVKVDVNATKAEVESAIATKAQDLVAEGYTVTFEATGTPDTTTAKNITVAGKFTVTKDPDTATNVDDLTISVTVEDIIP